jgi:hypothetical protein
MLGNTQFRLTSVCNCVAGDVYLISSLSEVAVARPAIKTAADGMVPVVYAQKR